MGLGMLPLRELAKSAKPPGLSRSSQPARGPVRIVRLWPLLPFSGPVLPVRQASYASNLVTYDAGAALKKEG